MLLGPGEKETGAWGVTVAIIATPFLVLGYEVSNGNWWVGGPVALAVSVGHLVHVGWLLEVAGEVPPVRKTTTS